ncbi:hypothetical protein [Stygiolobus sp. CP8521M]
MLSPILRYHHSLSFPRLKEAMAIEAKYLNKKGFPKILGSGLLKGE